MDGISQRYYWFDYFVQIAKEAQMAQDSTFFAFIGRRRSGKSVDCLAMCSAIDPDITEENIVFTLNDLRAAFREKSNTAIMWDEASVSAYNRDFMQEANKLINKSIQVFGYKRLGLCSTFQHLNFLDSHAQMQLDCIFKCYSNKKIVDEQMVVNTFMSPYKIVTDWIQDPIIAPYKRPLDGVSTQIGSIPIPQIKDLYKRTGVSKKLYNAYLKKKEEFFDDVTRDDVSLDARTVKRLKRMEGGFYELIGFMKDEDYTMTQISAAMGIPQTTLANWNNKRKK